MGISYGHFMWEWNTLLCPTEGNELKQNAKGDRELYEKLKIPCHLFCYGGKTPIKNTEERKKERKDPIYRF